MQRKMCFWCGLRVATEIFGEMPSCTPCADRLSIEADEREEEETLHEIIDGRY